MVLRGATSQWKRSRGDSRPIGPAPVAAGADRRRSPPGAARIASRSAPGSSASSAGLVELDPRLEEAGACAGDDHADVDELAALDARHHADDGVVIRVRSRARTASSTNARGARGGARSSRGRRRGARPTSRTRGSPASQLVGNERRRCARSIGRRQPRGQRARRPRRCGSAQRQQHMVADQRERARAARRGRRPSRGGSTAPRRGR